VKSEPPLAVSRWLTLCDVVRVLHRFAFTIVSRRTRPPAQPILMKKLFVILLVVCASAFADQIVLTNGDRLTGVIKRYDDQKLYLQPDYAGEIAIKWSAIATVTGDKPLHVERTDHTRIAADAITAHGTDVTIESIPAPVTVPAKDIKAIRSDSEELAYEKSLNPGWWRSWRGGGNFGVALAHGNSETTSVSLGFASDRKTVNDKLSMYANAVYSMNGQVGTTTANDIRGGARYDRDMSKRLFGYVAGDLEHDGLQALDVRAVLGTGLGYHAINTKTASLDFLGGGAYTREDYGTGISNDLGTSSFGVQYAKTLRSTTTFTQKAFMLPYLNSLGDYRATFDSGMATKISRLLTWQVNLSDHYVTNPQPTFRENDLMLTTGIGVTFGKKE
jgi:putative salt-induced outer membrane protein